jgi:hypothetical protein
MRIDQHPRATAADQTRTRQSAAGDFASLALDFSEWGGNPLFFSEMQVALCLRQLLAMSGFELRIAALIQHPRPIFRSRLK